MRWAVGLVALLILGCGEQVQKPAPAAPPTSRVMPWRSTVTSVRIVRLAPRLEVSVRKNLARPDSHW